MIQSMTGFGCKEVKIVSLGKISVEIRSTNHKFLEIVLHLPEGFLSLEDKVKKEIESRLKRGRITCVINITGGKSNEIFINEALLKKYTTVLGKIQKQFRLENGLSLDTLIHLPGVLSLEEKDIDKTMIWPRLKILVNQTLSDLLRMRQKEGAALRGFLKNRAQELKNDLDGIKARFKDVIKNKTANMKSDDERASFLKDVDITEELDRLTFHIKNCTQKLAKGGSVGKELDFIAQEMQRETNTIGAKCCDTVISAKVVQIKSHIEKIREQVQNIE